MLPYVVFLNAWQYTLTNARRAVGKLNWVVEGSGLSDWQGA
jgi:hypothetical protein